MNQLLLGIADKTEQLLHKVPLPFLLIDDGQYSEAFLEAYPRASVFDPHKHSFNPLRGMDYKRGRDFANLLYGISPQGENTLTVKNGRRRLAERILVTKRLDKFPRGTDPADLEAAGMIDDVLFSPVVRSVTCRTPTFTFDTKKAIIARLSRAELGDFDCKVLAAMLIGQFKGHVVVPDFGFYACELYTSLIQQNRLVAGVNYLDELKDMRQAVLTIKDKQGQGCVFEDAEVLASFAGLTPTHNNYTDFIEGAMR